MSTSSRQTFVHRTSKCYPEHCVSAHQSSSKDLSFQPKNFTRIDGPNFMHFAAFLQKSIRTFSFFVWEIFWPWMGGEVRNQYTLFTTDAAVQTLVAEVPDEQRLYSDLMEQYEPAVRPVLNASSAIIVNFRLSLNQIVDLVRSSQILQAVTIPKCLDQDRLHRIERQTLINPEGNPDLSFRPHVAVFGDKTAS